MKFPPTKNWRPILAVVKLSGYVEIRNRRSKICWLNQLMSEEFSRAKSRRWFEIEGLRCSSARSLLAGFILIDKGGAGAEKEKGGPMVTPADSLLLYFTPTQFIASFD